MTQKQKMLWDTPRKLHSEVQKHTLLPNQVEYMCHKQDMQQILTNFFKLRTGFDVSGISDEHKLLKFSFVRHPVER